MVSDNNIIEAIKFCLPYTVIDDKDSIENIPDILKKTDQEFCVALEFSPEFVNKICYEGCLPMADMLTDNIELLLIKLHANRCILSFDNLHIPKNISRYCKGLEFSIDSDFTSIIENIKKHHYSNCWLHPKLIECFSGLFKQNQFKTRIHTIEVWDNNLLVAGEIGYSVGSIYTSLSGFYTKNGAGKVQLIALSKFLQANNFSFWDMGMGMRYKFELGALPILRKDFLKMVKKNRDTKNYFFTESRIKVEKIIF